MVKTCDMEQQVAKLQRQCADYIVEISKKEHEIAVLNVQINDLQYQTIKGEMIRPLIRRLFREFDRKIMLWFTVRGKKRQPISFRPRLNIDLVGDESYSQLLGIARKCDVQEFFLYKYKSSRSSLRFQYRIIAKAYRVGRDGMLRVVGLVCGVSRRVRGDA